MSKYFERRNDRVVLTCGYDVAYPINDMSDDFISLYIDAHNPEGRDANVVIFHSNDFDGYCSKEIIASFENVMFDIHPITRCIEDDKAFSRLSPKQKIEASDVIYIIGISMQNEVFNAVEKMTEGKPVVFINCNTDELDRAKNVGDHVFDFIPSKHVSSVMISSLFSYFMSKPITYHTHEIIHDCVKFYSKYSISSTDIIKMVSDYTLKDPESEFAMNMYLSTITPNSKEFKELTKWIIEDTMYRMIIGPLGSRMILGPSGLYGGDPEAMIKLIDYSNALNNALEEGNNMLHRLGLSNSDLASIYEKKQ